MHTDTRFNETNAELKARRLEQCRFNEEAYQLTENTKGIARTLAEWNANQTIQIADLLTDDGKKMFGNDTSRASELLRRQGASDEWNTLSASLDKLTAQIDAFRFILARNNVEIGFLQADQAYSIHQSTAVSAFRAALHELADTI